MEQALKIAEKGEIRANKGLFGTYRRESVSELEKSAKSLKTALSEKTAKLERAEHLLSVEKGWRDERIRRLTEEREALLTDDGLREKTMQKRFEKALDALTLELAAKARQIKQKGANTGTTNVVDDAVRRHMKKLNPRLNPWEALDRYSGGRRSEVERKLRDRLEKAIGEEGKIGRKTGVRR